MDKDYSGIDFLWTWARIGDKENKMLLQPYRQHALLCSTLSVQKCYPGARRRLFLDQETYDFFKVKGWLELWDEVTVFELPDTLGAKKYYAYPKLYTYRFVEKPTFIIDVEVICKNPFPIEDPSKVITHWWKCKDVDYFLKWWVKDQDYWPNSDDSYISAGFLYIPSSKIAKTVSNRACKRVDRIAKFCTFENVYAGWQVYVEDGILTHWFKTICGIDYVGPFHFEDYYNYNPHFLKYQNYDKVDTEVDMACETKAGLKDVYRKYIGSVKRFI